MENQENVDAVEVVKEMGVQRAGDEFPEVTSPTEANKPEQLSDEQVQLLKKEYPNSKLAFFVHVDDVYLYRSYTIADLDALNANKKQVEDTTKKPMTDDEYLSLFLNYFVCVPEKCGDRNTNKTIAAGLPHLLYDLINHLSGFASVDPVVL